MAGRPALEELRLRRDALVLESELNRLSLRTEFENIRAATQPLNEAAATARRMGPWVLPLAVAGGIVAALLLRRRSGLGALTSLARWVPTALTLCQHFCPVTEKSAEAHEG